MANPPKLLSGRVLVTPYGNLTADRYQFLGLNQAEPSLGAGAANSVLTLGTGNTRVWGNALNLSGNVSANYFLGNGSQLTGVTATSAGFPISAGNSVISATINGNISVAVNGVSNVVVFAPTGEYVTGVISATGNITGGNVITVGQVSATGNITGNTFVGNGVGLSSTSVDRGSDINDWDSIVEMGVYTVNRSSWAGTVGTPLDSQVFVGLLEVKNSTGTTLTQSFYPGQVNLDNVTIQWSRNYWSGSWTLWVVMINGSQQINGGEFN
jgi:hypothetical protein